MCQRLKNVSSSCYWTTPVDVSEAAKTFSMR